MCSRRLERQSVKSMYADWCSSLKSNSQGIVHEQIVQFREMRCASRRNVASSRAQRLTHGHVDVIAAYAQGGKWSCLASRRICYKDSSHLVCRVSRPAPSMVADKSVMHEEGVVRQPAPNDVIFLVLTIKRDRRSSAILLCCCGRTTHSWQNNT